MKLDVRIGDVVRTIEIVRDADGRLRIHSASDGMEADAVEIAPDTFSILLNHRVFDVRITPAPDGLMVRCGGQEFAASVSDPRVWKARQHSLGDVDGPQQVSSPMAGRIVRLLVVAGEQVKSRQGLLVVEAMKMQNEIRAAKAGTVGRVLVTEGQTISAGELLMTIA